LEVLAFERVGGAENDRLVAVARPTSIMPTGSPSDIAHGTLTCGLAGLVVIVCAHGLSSGRAG